MPDEIKLILEDVESELVQAIHKHGPFCSLHEAYAVILEELDEAWEEIKIRRDARNLETVKEELIQVAAMAVRAIYDCLLLGETK